MKGSYIVAAVLLVIPTVVLLDVPLYNKVNPELAGVPFFWWFQGLWLVIAAIMYLGAALILTSADPDKGEFN
ncbi:MAG: DUF3311 domain-containing protein [Methanomassiliicoccales archaeon]